MQIHTLTSIPTNNLSASPRSKPPSKRDAEIIEEVERVRETEQVAYHQRSRFAMRTYLKQVYRLYCRWKQTGEVNRKARRAANLQRIPVRRGTHPLKILIDLTTPANYADAKARSRMARAMEFAAAEGIRPRGLGEFFDQSGGIAGAAGQMVLRHPRRIRRVNDW